MGNMQTESSPRRWPIFAGFAVAGLIFVAALGASFWQSGVADSKRDDAQAYTDRAALLEGAGVEGRAAAEGLQTYVEQGDVTLLPQIKGHTDAGVEKLTAALAMNGASDVSGLLSAASDLVDGSSQVVTLRQSGDVAGAAAALEQLSAEFEPLIETQQTAIEAEQAAAASTLSDADSAEDVAGWLSIVAIVVAAVTGGALLIVLRRVVFGRRVPGPASSVR